MYDGNVAVAYTSERALAFSGLTGRWTEERFRIRETVVSLSADGNVGYCNHQYQSPGVSVPKMGPGLNHISILVNSGFAAVNLCKN